MTLEHLLSEVSGDTNESSFLLFMRNTGNEWQFEDVPVIVRGDEMSTLPIMYNNDARKLNKQKPEGVHSFAGHSHPNPYGELILPYNCGWTMPREQDHTEHRNKELSKTAKGRNIITLREQLIQQAIGPVEERNRLKQEIQEAREAGSEDYASQLSDRVNSLGSQLRALQAANVQLAPDLHVVNLTTHNGIPGFITNQFNFEDVEHLRADTNPYSGDFEQARSFLQHKYTGQALIHADPRYALTPSTPDKFVMSVLTAQESGLENATRIDYKH